MKKAAIVGCGSIAKTHAENLSARKDVAITAVCDILPQRAEALAQIYAPQAKVYDDFEAMLAQENMDVLHVCTPHYLHCEMACAALKKNINVLLEKPVCINLQQAELLQKAEEESRAKICISFQNRYLSAAVLPERFWGRPAACFGTEMPLTIPKVIGAALWLPRAAV